MYIIGIYYDCVNTQDRIAAYASHFPSGVSTWVLAHFLQWSVTGRFARFDYGSQQNLIRYGQQTPPEYQLGRIKLKRISIFYSLNDPVAYIRDVQRIKRFLKGIENSLKFIKQKHFFSFIQNLFTFEMNYLKTKTFLID